LRKNKPRNETTGKDEEERRRRMFASEKGEWTAERVTGAPAGGGVDTSAEPVEGRSG
jgi:hypothetical protein